jgi:hypothetical protein
LQPAYLLAGQLLEIIFTFCTVKLGCDPAAPPEADDPPAEADDPAPLLALPDAPPASDPVSRT